MTVTVEHVDPDFILERLQEIYRKAYRPLARYAYQGDREIAMYLRWLKKRAAGKFIVSRADDDLVTGFIAVDPNWFSWNGQRLGEIHEVAVDPDCQGQGIGKTLLLAGLEHLRRQGHKKFELWVGEKNDRAKSLYAELGFQTKGKWGKWIRMIREEQ